MKKVCTKCKKLTSLGFFQNDSRRNDGKRSECSTCTSEYQKEWAKKNDEKLKKYRHEYYMTNKELR